MPQELTSEGVVRMLKQRQGDKSLRRFAQELGISPAYLSDLYRGNRHPGDKVLTALGLKFTVIINNHRKRRIA